MWDLYFVFDQHLSISNSDHLSRPRSISPYPWQLLRDASDVLSFLADDEAMQPGWSGHLHHHHTLCLQRQKGCRVQTRSALTKITSVAVLKITLLSSHSHHLSQTDL